MAPDRSNDSTRALILAKALCPRAPGHYNVATVPVTGTAVDSKVLSGVDLVLSARKEKNILLL